MSVFLRAIDVINERGWGKGKYDNRDTGEVCLIGACAAAADMSPGDWETTRAWCTLAAVTPNKWPTGYNDSVAKSKEDIINILQKAHEYECELAAQTEHLSVPPA
jgi:hypothetical protein